MATKKKICCCSGICNHGTFTVGYSGHYLHTMSSRLETLNQDCTPYTETRFESFESIHSGWGMSYQDIFPPSRISLRPFTCDVSSLTYQYPIGADTFPLITPNACPTSINWPFLQSYRCQANPQAHENLFTTGQGLFGIRGPFNFSSNIVWQDEAGAFHTSLGAYMLFNIDMLFTHREFLDTLDPCYHPLYLNGLPGSGTDYNSFNNNGELQINVGTVFVAMLWDIYPNIIRGSNGIAQFQKPDRAIFIGNSALPVKSCQKITDETFPTSPVCSAPDGTYHQEINITTRCTNHSKIITAINIDDELIPGYGTQFSAVWYTNLLERTRTVLVETGQDETQEYNTPISNGITFNFGAYVP